jgi:putative component of membrane protein insertase Oxa1/YidC/SpoIIIJ protein YidD
MMPPAACLLLAALLYSCAMSTSPPAGRPAGFLAAVLEIYRGPLNHLYAIRGAQCPMYPTCSEYSRQAIARHGLVIGWMMTTDRLLRCGRDETRLAPRIMIDGQLKTYDPVEENDFWWYSDQRPRSPHTRQPATAAVIK